MLEIYLVRHGETIFNAKSKMQGWSDSELLSESISNSYELGEHFNKMNVFFDLYFSSDSSRAITTLECVQRGMGVKEDVIKLENFREFYFGQAETLDTKYVWNLVARRNGLDVHQLLTTVNAISRCNMLHLLPEFDLAENRTKFEARVNSTFQEIIDYCIRYKKERIIVVSHGITIISILQNCGLKQNLTRSLANLSYSVIKCDNRKCSVKDLGKTIF